MPDLISVQVNDLRLQVPAGTSVAAAVFLAGQATFRTSVKGQPRGALCGMGICFECRLTIDGIANRRSCQIPVRPEMVIKTT
jgi:sarcosine oxidase subunit alpha